MEPDEFRNGQRAVWETGDYRPVGRLLQPGAEVLVRRAGVGPGHRVLDVGVGSGSVSVAAARVGGEVVGIDITDAWFEEARRLATAAGVELDLRLGDAAALPVGDASFDVVLSSFAAIFAPDHGRVAAELVRVCRPGGTIGLTAWPPDGASNETLAPLLEALPPPPDYVTPSILWGDPDHVRDLFADHPVSLTFDRGTIPVRFPSIDAFEAFAFENSGPVIAARGALVEMGTWEGVARALRAAIERTNRSSDGSFAADWDFLLILAGR